LPLADDARPSEELEYSDDVVVELDDICVASEEYFMDADVYVIHVADQPCTRYFI